MASVNKKSKNIFSGSTHEGAPAVRIQAEQELRRSVMSCLLWEDSFYEEGEDIAARIWRLALSLPPKTVADVALEARDLMNLRHVPLLLLVALCKIGSGQPIVAQTIANVIRRADELAELLALYWKKNGKDAPLSKQLRLGLAKAFLKFDAYQFGKYNRDSEIKLRDVMFLVHPKPETFGQETLFNQIAENTLESPDTWEVSLSNGADKAETFTRLLQEGKLGYLALLRNLRNMEQSGVDRGLIVQAIKARKGADRVLPFRFTAAARSVPSFEPALDEALLAGLKGMTKLTGKTIVLVDVSGSMDYELSEKSDLSRLDAAATLASIVVGDDVRTFTFSEHVIEVPHRLGMAGVQVIINSQTHWGTYLGEAITQINKLPHDRLIVITDEQSHDPVPSPVAEKAYMINVASYQHGVGYRRGWKHIDGFSENILRWIAEIEREEAVEEWLKTEVVQSFKDLSAHPDKVIQADDIVKKARKAYKKRTKAVAKTKTKTKKATPTKAKATKKKVQKTPLRKSAKKKAKRA